MKPFAILMANWNKGEFVGEAIDSVLGQTNSDWILIVVDDGSTDRSLDEIGKRKDPRIRLIQISHGGPGAAYRAAAGEAFKDYEVRGAGVLDSDDLLHPEALDKVVQAYDELPDIGCIYTQNWRCSPDMGSREVGRCRKIPPGETVLSLLDRGDFLRASHWYTFRKEAYFRTAGFQPQARHQDMDLVLRLEEVTGLFFIDQPLYSYRMLEDGLHSGKTFKDFAPLVRARAQARRSGQPEPMS